MDLKLHGRRAVVAAGTSGLGLGTAMALAREGAHVSVCGRDPARLEHALQRLAVVAGDASSVHGVVTDVRNDAALTGWVDAAEDHFGGGVDIAVANAGGPRKGSSRQFTVADYRQAVELSLFPSIVLAERVQAGMLERRWGRLLFIASVSVLHPIPSLALSNVARPGVVGYAKSLVADFGDAGVTVNVLAPGTHDTARVTEGHATVHRGPTSEGRRMGAPEDFGSIAAFVCSEQASFMTGVVLPIDGGEH